MKDEFDVIVVGGGPAGTTTARFAAENGADVLLLEKRPEIGAPKRCGEGLSLRAITQAGLKPSDEWCRQEIQGAYVIAPNGKEVEARYGKTEGYVIERKMFDKRLAIIAAEAGATIQSGSRVTGVLGDKDKITGVTINTRDGNHEIKCKVLVAADGVESLIARWAGVNSTHALIDICSAVQFEMSNISFKDPKMLEIYLGNDIAPGGYVWIFPKGPKTANVGIGIRANKNANALALLQKFVNSRPELKNGSVIEINGGGVPVGKPLESLVANGLMVVGDAAHQVNAIHGGGIGESLESGKLAGIVAAKCIKNNDCSKPALIEYQTTWYATAGKKLAKLVNLRKVLEAMSDADLNFLADELSGDDVINLTKAEKFLTLTKIFAKRPSMLKYAPMLLG